jgi:hypothetical protein
VKAAGYSTNGGTSWTAVASQPSGVAKGEGTCAVNANGTRFLWSPGDAAVHYSSNSGKTWAASTGVPAGALVESDRVNPNKFYAFKDGTFYVSTNGGAAFTVAASGLPASIQFKAVAGREGHIWAAALTSGLLRSTNSGATFTAVAGVTEADNIGFGKAATGQTYPAIYSSAEAGGIRGIFRSDNEGATWVRINDNAHQYAWTGKTITGDPRVYGRVYLGTNGRGIICGDITTGSGRIATNEGTTMKLQPLKISPNPSNGKVLRLALPDKPNDDETYFITVTDMSGNKVHESSTKFATDDDRLSIELSSTLKAGFYIVKVRRGSTVHLSRVLVE